MSGKIGLRRTARLGLAILSVVIATGCRDDPAAESIDVSLGPGEVYEYPVAAGDEDGAHIVTQPLHAAVSEIRRDATTNWVPVYVYQPRAGYSGPDWAELEARTGSDGASPPTQVRRIVFRFSIAR